MSTESTKQLLNYFQNQTEHPVIQAALAHGQLTTIRPFDQKTELIARILGYLLLYKHAYDFRSFLVLEEYWKNDPNLFQNSLESIKKDGNSNRWLSYYTQGVINQAQKAYDNLSHNRFSLDLPRSYFALNDRQREIMNMLEQPETIITNKKVQKMFKVSQITASRDLTMLASLGLLFHHGKGRAVYYTKV